MQGRNCFLVKSYLQTGFTSLLRVINISSTDGIFLPQHLFKLVSKGKYPDYKIISPI